jgi:hypothetical protein
MEAVMWKPLQKLLPRLPERVRNKVETLLDAVELLGEVHDPKVLASLGPSGVRGLVLQRGKQGTPTRIGSGHKAYFDWTYPADQPAMRDLYTRAKRGQWDSDTHLPWNTSVDTENPETSLLPMWWLDWNILDEHGIHLDTREKQRLLTSIACWSLSQFLHGEQGALLAAAQVTEAVQFFDGKLYGSTQVVDEGRHVEVFSRYLDQKVQKLYQINDNLFVIIDALMSDSRWDMKFLGMQIMVEGLALGAFGTLYQVTKEPLLKQLLKMVIQDEARHVHYGVLALREHIATAISERERREREDWAFEVALLMRNRFMGFEVYDEWFSGRLPRDAWKKLVTRSPGMQRFRQVMFSRLVPNLREIGLLTPRIIPRYSEVGLMEYFDGKSARDITGESMLAELDAA